MRFDCFEPSSVAEATDILRRGNGRYRALAGGTDVIIQLRRRMANWEGLVNIKRLPDVATWSVEAGKGLHVGTAVPFRELETSETVQERYPALKEAIGVIGSLQLRNSATIGGNVCNASPAADSVPALMVSGATATFISDSTSQTLPIENLFTGPGRTVLGSAGLLLWLDLPEPPGMSGSCFERLTPRSALDIGIVSAASQVTLGPGGMVERAAIALGAVAPTPVRASESESALLGHEPTPELLARVAGMASKECSPMDDIRGSASYRRAMVEVLVRRTLERAVERARRN
jgi:carbon-monoxide dehydrogenase medium subunit